MKKLTLMFLIFAGLLAVYLYINRKERLDLQEKFADMVSDPLGSVGDNTQGNMSTSSTPCSWLKQEGYSVNVVTACENYQNFNGFPSTASLVLNVSENFEPFEDNSTVAYIVGAPKMNPLSCSQSDPCPPIGVSCQKDACL